MDLQHKLDDNPRDLMDAISTEQDLRHFHHSKGMSKYEIAYEYCADLDSVEQLFERFNVSDRSPQSWQNDTSLLRRVADEDQANKLADCLGEDRGNVAMTVGPYKKGTNNNEKIYQDPEKLKDVLDSCETFVDTVDKLGVSIDTINKKCKKHYGKPLYNFADRNYRYDVIGLYRKEDYDTIEAAKRAYDGRPMSETKNMFDLEADYESEAESDNSLDESLLELIDLEQFTDSLDGDVSFATEDGSVVATVSITSDSVVDLEKETEITVFEGNN